MKLLDRAAWQRFVVPTSAWLDGAVILGLLALINNLAAHDDFGWLRRHPTPYLLAPILIGYRYGFLSGALSGVFTAGMVLGVRAWMDDVPFAAKALDESFLALGLVIIGAVCGEIQHAPRRRELRLTALLENAQQRLRRLDADLRLLRETKAELERVLAAQDAEVATLDADMRRLFESEGDELYMNLLLLLNRQTRISDCLIYAPDDSGDLVRKAAIGSTRLLPAQTKVTDIEMVDLALKNKTAVTIPGFWKEGVVTQRDYVLALPLLDVRDEPVGVLVVTGIPFMALTQRTIQLAGLICRWAGRVLEMRAEPAGTFRLVGGVEGQRVFAGDVFRRQLELAYDSSRLHNLASAVVMFATPAQPATLQDRLERAVIPNVRTGDFAAQLELRSPNIVVLLPLTGERGAAIFRERVMFHCRKDPMLAGLVQPRWIALDATRDFDEFWEDLLREPTAARRGVKLPRFAEPELVRS